MQKIVVYDIYGNSERVDVLDNGRGFYVRDKHHKDFKNAYNHALRLMKDERDDLERFEKMRRDEVSKAGI